MIRSPMIDAALSYAARGWWVFPADIKHGQKKSHKAARFSGGENWGATVNPAQIKRDFKKWPDAIGIVTGPKSGIFVVEADTPRGHKVDGINALIHLEDKHGKLPDTLKGKSPTGSVHHYFNCPKDVVDQEHHIEDCSRRRRARRWRHGDCSAINTARQGTLSLAQ